MSWKPSRGRLLLDKALQKSHELYFKYWELTTIKEKSKCFFQMIRADEVTGTKISKSLQMYKSEVDMFLQNTKDVYKPLLKIINNDN